jgi:predicted transcriptional regulator
MRRPHPTLTPQELAIMKIVWRKEEATVRDVHAAMSETRPIAYTTVMTLMRILQEKGYLTKATQEKAHVYRPAKPQKQVIGGMVRDFLDRVFDGASDALLVHLARDNKLTAKQKQIVRRLLEESDQEE